MDDRLFYAMLKPLTINLIIVVPELRSYRDSKDHP